MFFFIWGVIEATMYQKVSEWILWCVRPLRPFQLQNVQYFLSAKHGEQMVPDLVEWIPRVRKDQGGPVWSVVRRNHRLNIKTNLFKCVFLAERERYSFSNKCFFLPKE